MRGSRTKRHAVPGGAVVLLAAALLLVSACSSAVQPQSQPDAEQSAQFDPDAAELERLVFWGSLDGFVHHLPISPSQQLQLDALLDSDAPSADKYLIDLATFPNPYWDQVVAHIAERFGGNDRSVFAYPAIFDFDPSDAATPAYLRFKHALIASRYPDMATLIDPLAAIEIDAREVVWGGVAVDGIPPLEFPSQVIAEQAKAWMNGTDIVVGAKVNGDARAYPIRIIAWHEMVNDTIGGVPVSLAYCTLCGSAILFDGRVGSEVYRFGTSGLLYRSNKLMYDRSTRTLWNQFSGTPAWGPLVGQDIRLSVLPVVVTTWADWLARHPDSTVLNIETGHIRDYSPGAAYREYFSSPDTWFNVPIADNRLAQKDIVYSVRIGEALTAFPIATLATRRFALDNVGDKTIVVIATANGEGGRAYETGSVQFVAADPQANTITDAKGHNWQVDEDALIGPNGERLPRLPGHNAYWFAVTNQIEGSRLWEG